MTTKLLILQADVPRAPSFLAPLTYRRTSSGPWTFSLVPEAPVPGYTGYIPGLDANAWVSHCIKPIGRIYLRIFMDNLLDPEAPVPGYTGYIPGLDGNAWISHCIQACWSYLFREYS